jgi:hypothetical protein
LAQKRSSVVGTAHLQPLLFQLLPQCLVLGAESLQVGHENAARRAVGVSAGRGIPLRVRPALRRLLGVGERLAHPWQRALSSPRQLGPNWVNFSAVPARRGDERAALRAFSSPLSGYERVETTADGQRRTLARPNLERTLHACNSVADARARVDQEIRGNPARLLPTRVWANRQIRAFVPARYVVGFDRSYPDISKLPSPAGKALAQYKHLKRHGCQILRTGQARALLQAFVKAGISPSDNHAWTIAFDSAGMGLPRPSYLHLHPALPDDRC